MSNFYSLVTATALTPVPVVIIRMIRPIYKSWLLISTKQQRRKHQPQTLISTAELISAIWRFLAEITVNREIRNRTNKYYKLVKMNKNSSNSKFKFSGTLLL